MQSFLNYLAGTEDINNILDKFKFWPDQTSDSDKTVHVLVLAISGSNMKDKPHCNSNIFGYT